MRASPLSSTSQPPCELPHECLQALASIGKNWSAVHGRRSFGSADARPLPQLKVRRSRASAGLCRRFWPEDEAPDRARHFRSLGLTARARSGPQIVEDDPKLPFLARRTQNARHGNSSSAVTQVACLESSGAQARAVVCSSARR